MEKRNIERLPKADRSDLPDLAKQIIAKAEYESNIQESLIFEGTTSHYIPLPTSEIEDPDRAYDLTYRKIMKIKRKFLPGRTYKSIRETINLYLKEGHEFGRDSRQAKLRLMTEAYNELAKWLTESNGNDKFSLMAIFSNKLQELKRDSTSNINKT